MLLVLLGGFIVGSFLNVCIYRIPLNQSILFPPSYCPNCNVFLNKMELIPILSYSFLKGQCRHCHIPISFRYPFIELFTGILFVLCYFYTGYDFESLGLILYSSFLIVITFIDLDHQLIFDKVLVWFAASGLIFNLLHSYVSFPKVLESIEFTDMIIGIVSGGLLFLFIALFSKGGMGGGDIKFAASLGLWLGWKLNLLALFLAFIFGGIIGSILLAFKRKDRKDSIPFGPFIALGAFIAILYGQKIINWYFQSTH